MNRLRYFTGAATGFCEILRAPRLQNADDVIRTNLANRAETFLELLRRVVFANPSHPYRHMLEIAGCAYGDLEAAVRRDGLEETLRTLHRSGVYLAHDEFKLTRPIVRSHRTIAADAASFRNPLSAGRFISWSGGSRSAGTVVSPSTKARVYREAYDRLTIDEFGLTERQYLLVKPILPAIDGLLNLARAGRLGCPIDTWFSPVVASADTAHYRWATLSLVAMARGYGVQIPFPSHLPANDFSPVVRLIADRRRQRRSVLVRTYASPAVRVVDAARDMGVSLEGVLFLVGGETLTDAKRAAVEASGAEIFPHYAISELGSIGHACRRLTTGNDVHLNSDSLEVITHRRRAPLSGDEVDSLLFTTLQLHPPFVFINVEMDDCGTLDRTTPCGCRYARLGLTTIVRNISSFGKLTGHGVTLVGTDIVRILEQTLPATFGGSAADYQLVEHEASDQARITLRVSRRVPIAEVGVVRDRFLAELRACHGGQIAYRLWQHAGAFEVVHDNPIVSSRGKVLPLHVLGSGAGVGMNHG